MLAEFMSCAAIAFAARLAVISSLAAVVLALALAAHAAG
jgi:hypothetical protein